jgi:hypothetical protein
MIFLPIVVRELRVAARRKSTYRTRFWTACAAVAFGGYLLLMSGAFMGRAQGTMVFNSLAGLCFLSCLSLARNTLDCISEEKREGTLGFLFLTDLKGHDITLGKLFSGSLISLYSLLGVFPVVAVSLLFGGVSAVEFWEVALALLNVFFFSQSAGIFVSALSRKRNTANFGAAAILLGYTIGFLCLSLGLRARGFDNLASLFEWLNLGYCVYWASLLFIHLNAWLFLAVASWWLPRSWQERPAKTRVRWRERLLQRYHFLNTPRRALLDANPFLWLSLRNRLGPVKVWIGLALIDGFWIWCLSRNTFEEAGMPIFIAAILSNHLLLKILAASEASGTLEEQRHSGALEFLLSCTPLTVEEIVAGQWLALRRQLLRPMFAILAADFAMLLVVLVRATPNIEPKDKGDFALFVAAVAVMLFADLISLGWVGMWSAMSQKKPRHAAGRAVAQILFLPWMFLIFIQSLSIFSQSPIIDSFTAAVALWFFFGIGVDIVAVRLARHRLLAEFRTRAAPSIGEELGLLGQLGRWLGKMARGTAGPEL